VDECASHVPASDSREGVRAAAGVLLLVGGDVVVVGGRLRPRGIERRVDVAERRLALRDAVLEQSGARVSHGAYAPDWLAWQASKNVVPERVDHRDHGSDGRRRSRRATDWHHDTIDNHLEVSAHGTQVGEGTARATLTRTHRQQLSTGCRHR